MHQVKQSFLVLMLGGFLLAGCSFNEPTEASKQVMLVKAYNVTGCQKLGDTVARVKDSLGGVKFSEKEVQEELIVIAKNDAAKMGGDSIVAVSDVKGGVQKFAIYRCQK